MLTMLAAALVSGSAGAQESVDPGFRPVLTEAKLSAEALRPGAKLAIEFSFTNEGESAAKREYTVFLHLEHPEATCENIRISAHYRPAVATTRWEPGRSQRVGPYAVTVPADAEPGEYHVHVGIYDADGGGQRLCEAYEGTLTVDPNAPEHDPRQPPLAKEEADRRRAALLGRLTDPVNLDCGACELRVDEQTGSWELYDKHAPEVWSSNPLAEGFGEVTLRADERTVNLPLDKVDRLEQGERHLVLHYKLAPEPDVEYWVRIRLERVGGPDGVKVSYEGDNHAEWSAVAARLMDNSLTVTNNDGGQLVVPHRLGLLMRADGGLPDTRVFRAYANANAYSMAFVGAVKNGSAVMVTWDDPYTRFETRGEWADHAVVPGSHSLSVSMLLSESARSFSIHTLGKGDYVDIGKRYREVAGRRGLLRTWADKAKANADVVKMHGAVDFKPFVLSRTVAGTRYNETDQDRINLGYTFDEAAQIAEHLRNDLDIERAMYVLAGWIHLGYDNQHPDILPAAPECGGSEALTDCGERVRACGYLFGLHDNYQDMYRDAPSWDETYVMKNRDGSLRQGGVWAGGQAYLTCSKKALELAKRPQNLNEVRRLFHPGIYFIDTTYAAPPFECHDPDHPLTLQDDIYWKNELAKYAGQVFGLFGSEEGQEWAVPDAAYFEGLMSHKTGHSGQEVIPLFEVVFGDCLNLYTHQGDRATASRPHYILDHILYAENPLYHFGSHLYFQEQHAPATLPAKPTATGFRQTGPREFEVGYEWRVSGEMQRGQTIFVHFVNPRAERAEKIAFQDDHTPPTPTEEWEAGETVTVGPHKVAVPDDADGAYDMLIGITTEAGGRHALRGLAGASGRYKIGTVTVAGDEITFEPHDPASPGTDDVFGRSDDGWGQDLIETDRVIKNTYEVCSALNRLTASAPMTAHEFVSAEPRVERSEFGEFEITVNYGPGSYTVRDVELPPNGFLVHSPRFWAMHTTRFAGRDYDPSAMFVVESLDEKPITQSTKTRIFHAFGDPRIRIAGKEFEVEAEAEVAGG